MGRSLPDRKRGGGKGEGRKEIRGKGMRECRKKDGESGKEGDERREKGCRGMREGRLEGRW